jgi:hypothetical protein
MIDRAETVGDPVLASVTDEEQVILFERGTALGTFARVAEVARLDGLAGLSMFLPVRALHHPGDDVLEAAEGGAPVAGVLAEAVPVVGFDGAPAPGAGGRSLLAVVTDRVRG